MKKRKSLWKLIKKYFIITVFSFVYAVGISLLLDPNNLAPGGVTGVSIICNRIFGMETGTWFMILNIPILLLGLWKFGIRFIISTVYCTALTSVFTNGLSYYLPPVTEDKMLAAIAGGAVTAFSIGMIFKAGATTGGTDIIIKVMKLKFPHLKTGVIFLISDALVVMASAIVFQNVEVAMFAGISVVVNSMLLDMVLYGRDGAKMIYIISDKAEQIAERILQELDIGATYMNGQGAFSGNDKKVILCVVRKPMYPKTEEIVKEVDHEAFMIVTDATEIFGEGYKSYFSEKL